MEQERVLALYDAYADGVYRVALGYLRSAHDAEDAVQAVFFLLRLVQGFIIGAGGILPAAGEGADHLARARACVFDEADDQSLQKSARSGKALRAGGAGRAAFAGGTGGPRGASRGDGAAGKVPAGRGAALLGGILVFRDRRAAAADAVRRLHAPASGAKDVA